MASLPSLMAKIELDERPFESGINKVMQKTEQFSRKMQKVSASLKNTFTAMENFGKKAAVALTGVVGAITGLAKAAGTLETSQRKLNIVTAGNTEALNILEQASQRLARTTNYNSIQYRNTMASAYAMGKNYDFTAGQISNLVSISADLGTIYNKDLPDATERIMAAMRGEAEAAEALGLSLSQTAVEHWMVEKGISGVLSEMSLAQQAQIRYQMLLDKTSDSMGAAQDMTDTFESTWERLKNTFVEAAANTGKGSFLDPIKDAMNKIIDFLNIVNQSSTLQQFIADAIKLGLVFATIGTVIGILGKIGNMTLTILTTGFSLLTNPITWVVAGIILVITHLEDLKAVWEGAKEIWNAADPANIQSDWNAFISSIQAGDWTKSIKAGVTVVFDELKWLWNGVTHVWDTFQSQISSDLWEKAGTIRTLLSEGEWFEALKTFGEVTAEIIWGGIKAAGVLITEVSSWIEEKIRLALGINADTSLFVGVFDAAVNGIINVASFVWDQSVRFASDAFNTIMGWVKNITDAIASQLGLSEEEQKDLGTFGVWGKGILELLGFVWTKVTNVFEAALSVIAGKIAERLNIQNTRHGNYTIPESLGIIGQGALHLLNMVWDGVKNITQGALSSIAEKLNEDLQLEVPKHGPYTIPESLKIIGQGALKVIDWVIKGTVEITQNVWNKIINSINNAMGENQKKTYSFREGLDVIGRGALNIVEWLWNGVKTIAPQVWWNITGTIDRLIRGERKHTYTLPESLEVIGQAALNIVDWLWSGLQWMGQQIGNIFDWFADRVREKLGFSEDGNRGVDLKDISVILTGTLKLFDAFFSFTAESLTFFNTKVKEAVESIQLNTQEKLVSITAKPNTDTSLLNGLSSQFVMSDELTTASTTLGSDIASTIGAAIETGLNVLELVKAAISNVTVSLTGSEGAGEALSSIPIMFAAVWAANSLTNLGTKLKTTFTNIGFKEMAKQASFVLAMYTTLDMLTTGQDYATDLRNILTSAAVGTVVGIATGSPTAGLVTYSVTLEIIPKIQQLEDEASLKRMGDNIAAGLFAGMSNPSKSLYEDFNRWLVDDTFLKGIYDDVLEDFNQSENSFINNVARFGIDMGVTLVGAIVKPFSMLWQWIAEALSASWDKFVEIGTDIGNKIVEGIKNALKIFNPAEWFNNGAEVPPEKTKAIQDKVTSGLNPANNTMADFSYAVKDMTVEIPEIIVSDELSFGEKLSETMGRLLNDFANDNPESFGNMNTIFEVGSKAADAFETVFTGLLSLGESLILGIENNGKPPEIKGIDFNEGMEKQPDFEIKLDINSFLEQINQSAVAALKEINLNNSTLGTMVASKDGSVGGAGEKELLNKIETIGNNITEGNYAVVDALGNVNVSSLPESIKSFSESINEPLNKASEYMEKFNSYIQNNTKEDNGLLFDLIRDIFDMMTELISSLASSNTALISEMGGLNQELQEQTEELKSLGQNDAQIAMEGVKNTFGKATLNADGTLTGGLQSQMDAFAGTNPKMTELNDATASATSSLNTFEAKLAQAGASLLETLNPINIVSGWIGSLNSGLQGLISAIDPIAAIFRGINKALAPVLDRLMEPLEHLGYIIGKALIPVIEALIPVFTGLAYIVAGIWNALASVLNMILGIFGVAIPLINFQDSWEEEQSTPSDMTNTAGYHQPVYNTFNVTFTGNTVLDSDDEAMETLAEKFLQYCREHDIEVVAG